MPKFPADNNVTGETREETILKYAPLIKFISARIALRLPAHIDLNDVVNSGVLGLIDAIDKFDERKGVQFKTYAEFRIKGAILDNLRSMDWVPRSIRRTVGRLEKTYEQLEKQLNRPPSDEETAEALDVDIDTLHEMIMHASGVSLLSLEMISPQDDSRLKLLDCLADESCSSPLALLKHAEIREVIAQGIDSLDEKEKLVVSLYYYDELTMKEISMVLQLTESRVSQIHTKAIIKLRSKLHEELAAG